MLQFIRDGNRVMVRMTGELDHYCAQTVRRELDALIADIRVNTMILDFTALQFMDSSGIGVLLGRYRLLRDRGGQLAVIHMNDHVGRLFHMSGLGRVIPVLDEDAEKKHYKIRQEAHS